MSFEPRISALSVLQNAKQNESKIELNFTANEWKYYQQYIIGQKHIQTSSVGRFLDAVSSILEIQQYNYYEGEAALKLEVVVRNNPNKTNKTLAPHTPSNMPMLLMVILSSVTM